MPPRRSDLAAILIATVCGCTATGTVGVIAGATETTVGLEDDGDPTAASSLDLGGEGLDLCVARGNLGGVGPCEHAAPAPAFAPEIEWSWLGDGDATEAFVIPLVASLTDDNADDEIDLCDTPDIVVVTATPAGPNLAIESPPGRIAILDGKTGSPHIVLPTTVRPTWTPALGDIDGDGRIEIVTVAPTQTPDVAPFPSRVVALSADGAVEWTSEETFDA